MDASPENLAKCAYMERARMASSDSHLIPQLKGCPVARQSLRQTNLLIVVIVELEVVQGLELSIYGQQLIDTALLDNFTRFQITDPVSV